MDEHQIIQSIIDANDGDIIGSNVIQKLAYFAEKTIDGITLPKFEPYFFGPYSPDIALALDSLVTYSFLKETTVPGNMHDLRYTMTPDGQKITNKIKLDFPVLYEKINSVVELCRDYCNLKIIPLSYAAIIHSMLENKFWKKPNYSDITKFATDLDWNIKPNDVKLGLDLLVKLKLFNLVYN